MTDVSRLIRGTIRDSQRRKKFAEGGASDETAYDPMTGVAITPQIAPATDAEPNSMMDGNFGLALRRLTGTQFGEPRLQLWPEKMVRSGTSLAGDILSGEETLLPPGLRREDYTDIPPPQGPTEDSTRLGKYMGWAPGSWQPNDPVYERAQDMAGLAGGQTLLTGAGKEAAGAAAASSPRDINAFLHKVEGANTRREIDDFIAAKDAGQTPGVSVLADSQATGAPLAALEHAPKFYSHMETVIDAAPMQKGTGAQWLGTLTNRGVKPDELHWTGTQTFLEQNADQVLTKDQVKEHAGANKLELGEVERGGDPSKLEARARQLAEAENGPGSWDRIGGGGQEHYWRDARREMDTRYPEYQLPGGENYRERLLTLPARRNEAGDILGHGIGGDNYTSSHWDAPNVLVHRRSNEREVHGAPTAEQTAAVEARAANQAELEAIRSEQGAVAQQITRAAKAAEDVRRAQVYKDMTSGKLSVGEARRLLEEYHEHPELVPLQDKLQQLRAQEDSLSKNMPADPQIAKRALHLEEIQSDWHQVGRKQGYKQPIPANERPQAIEKLHDLERQLDAMHSRRDTGEYAALKIEADMLREKIKGSGIPDAPFKKNWHELALKDALREAAEKGFDRISWTPGAAQAKRYDLSKHIDDLAYDPASGHLVGYKDAKKVVDQTVEQAKLADVIGKDAADRILNNPSDKQPPAFSPKGTAPYHMLNNADLSLGGEGMKGFYDKMVPDYLNKIGKPHGVKVEKGTLPYPTLSNKIGEAPIENPVHYMDIPQSLKDQVLKKGFSLFEDSATAGAPIAALEKVDHGRPAAYRSPHEPATPPAAAAPAAGETLLDVGRGVDGAPGGAAGVREAELQAERWAGPYQPLPGLPQGKQVVDGQPFIPGPVARAHEVAERYMAGRDFGVPPPEKYYPIDTEHARAIATAFDEMAHAPNDPKVKAAYQALADETLAQYNAIVEHGGLKVTPVNAADYPYHGNPRAVVKDVADNNHMAFFKTDEGFGSAPVELAEHPLLKSSGVKVGDHDMLYNDLFRVVHDYFGHVKNGYGFRGAGEDNAWRAHAAMYSPEARRAMTTETRGQNSWLNYGPHGDFNRTANAADTIYAPQKIGLLPDWVMQDRPASGKSLFEDSATTGAPLGALEQQSRISTRLPTGKKNPENALGDERLKIDMAAMQKDPSLFAHNVGLVSSYPNLLKKETKGKPTEVAQRFVNYVKDNLLHLYDQVPENIRERSKKWYEGGNKIVNDYATEFNTHPNSSAGAVAALSPQKDWFQNVDLARRVHDIHFNKREAAYSPEMEKTSERIFGDPKFKIGMERIRGKTYGELTDIADKAMWLRLHDEAHNPRSHRLVTPEGEFGDVVRNASGAPSGTGWGSLTEIGKAILSLEANGDVAKISGLMGERHKVRNFYNNLIDPHSPHGDVTIDTHAVAAGLMRPLSGNSMEVAHNFGNYPGAGLPSARSSAVTGVGGTYGLYADAYRQAAEARGITPREMQSVTWEAVRGLFTDVFKSSKKNTEAVDAVWRKYQKGLISKDDARAQISELAGGITPPDWHGPGGRSPAHDEAGRHPVDPRQLPGDGVPGRDASAMVGRVGSRAAARPPPALAAGGRVAGKERAMSYPSILQRFADGGDVDQDTATPVAFDPAKLAALGPKAPVFDPAKLAAAKPKSMGASDVLSGVIENAPSSAWQFVKDIVRPVTHPIETASGIKDLGLGLLAKGHQAGIFPAVPQFSYGAPTNDERAKVADAMGGYLKDRYGGLENIKQSIAKDPVGVLSDASMVLTGGGSAAVRAPGIVGKTGEIIGNVGRAVDPLMAPVNAAKIGTGVVGNLLTHTGATPIQNAYKAGVEGGEAGDVFRGHMRGTADSVEPVEMAKRGLAGYRAERGRNYREGMGDITSIDRQMAPSDRVLDFGKINQAVDETERLHKFGVMDINKPAAETRADMMGQISKWETLPPATYHTIEGLDALKKSLGQTMMATAPGTPARTAASEIYNAVKRTIIDYDPKYAKVMKDYELASTQVRELERAMSLGEKASADTALRKLQSIMRNNVNTNYGRRLELGKLLEENGAKHLMAALSGQSLNAWFPRGLGKLGAEIGILAGLGSAGHAGAGALGGLGAVAALPFMSPRLMGEVAHGTGRTVGRGLNMSSRALGKVGLSNRALGNASYRLGRTTNPNEGVYGEEGSNPYAP